MLNLKEDVASIRKTVSGKQADKINLIYNNSGMRREAGRLTDDCNFSSNVPNKYEQGSLHEG